MRAVPSAAGRQRCVVDWQKRERQLSKSEDQGKQDGDRAPHLGLMVHELLFSAVREVLSIQVSSMHLDFPITL
jgi:hypothetical protein